jgi:hypothetical protein
MVGRCRCPHVTLWTGSFALLIIHLHHASRSIIYSYMRLPPAGNATTWTSLLPVPPPLSSSWSRARSRQDHLGVRLLRPVPLPCCCRLSAARSNSNLTDHMLRAILFFFLLGASSNPQACGRCSDRARFPWWSPCMHLECACMQCARGRPRRRVVLYLYRRSRLLRCSGVRVTSISCVEFMDLTVIAQEDSRR